MVRSTATTVAAYLATLPAERRATLAAVRRLIKRHLPKGYREAVKRRLQEGFRKAGKRLDMGTACVRFRALDDLALDAIAEVIASTPIDKYIAGAEAVRTGKR